MTTKIETGYRVRVRVFHRQTGGLLTTYYVTNKSGGAWQLMEEKAPRRAPALETPYLMHAKRTLKCAAIRDLLTKTYWEITEIATSDHSASESYNYLRKVSCKDITRYGRQCVTKPAVYMAEIVKFTRTIQIEEEVEESLGSEKLHPLLQLALAAS